MRATLLRSIWPFGVDVSERTPAAALKELVRSLHPRDSGSELMRVGPEGDGGYLVPDDLDEIEYVFSPGVSDQSGFEADLANRDMQVLLADYSVDGPAERNINFVFDKKFVGSFTDDVYITLDEWKAWHIGAFDGDLLLQMDIEGGEYETLLACSEDLLQQFRIIVVELHFLDQLLCRPWFDIISRVFRKLLVNHSVVHLHPNNCCGSVKTMGLEIPRIMEATFYRNDRLTGDNYATDFPHPLDADNTPKASLRLPRCWYRT
jgi:hypothetical protein